MLEGSLSLRGVLRKDNLEGEPLPQGWGSDRPGQGGCSPLVWGRDALQFLGEWETIVTGTGTQRLVRGRERDMTGSRLGAQGVRLRKAWERGPQAWARAARLPRDCPKYAAGVGEGRSQDSPTHLNHPLWSRRKKKQKAQHTGTRERCCLPPARTLQLPLLETLASCVCVKLLQSCRTVCDPLNCSPPGSSVHGILQVRILE